MIPSLVAGCTDAREYWESRHGRLDFENVYSVTEDPELRREIIGLLTEALDPLSTVPDTRTRVRSASAART